MNFTAGHFLNSSHLRLVFPLFIALFAVSIFGSTNRTDANAAVESLVGSADAEQTGGAPGSVEVAQRRSVSVELAPKTAPLSSDVPLAAAFEVKPADRAPLVINGVGDVNLDPGYIPAFALKGYEHAFSGMRELFLADDLTVINLECPASYVGTRVPKQFNFQCDPDALPIIKADGVDVANQANNHSLDYGADGMLDSKINIEAVGIVSVGTGATAADAHRPAIFEIDGWTVAVVGFGGVIPSYGWLATEDGPGMSDGDTIETMVAAVAAADLLADVVVVTIHWGKELQAGPPADDIVRAEAMIDAGADMIFGHHPHRLNSMDWYGDRPIAWSLGNFVWPSLSAAGSDTAVAQVIIEPDGEVRACLLDATIVSDGHPELDDPTRMSCDADSDPVAG